MCDPCAIQTLSLPQLIQSSASAIKPTQHKRHEHKTAHASSLHRSFATHTVCMQKSLSAGAGCEHRHNVRRIAQGPANAETQLRAASLLDMTLGNKAVLHPVEG